MHILYTGTRTPVMDDAALSDVTLVHVPLLRVEELPVDVEAASQWLRLPCAVVVVSGHGARVFARYPQLTGLLTPAHVLWAVGARTAARLDGIVQAQREGEGVPRVRVPDEEAQHFEGLCEAMRAAGDTPRRLLLFGLEGSPRTLREAMPAYDALELEAYGTRPTPPEQVAEATGAQAWDWIVLTSPRGVSALVEAARLAPALTTARMAAIGPTTAAALRDAGLPVDHVPDAPDVRALLREITAQR